MIMHACKKKKVSVCTWNVNGLISKYKNKIEDECFIEQISKNDIVGLTETHVDDNADIHVDGYSLYRKSRPKLQKARRNHGGLLILVRNNLKPGVKHLECINPNYHWVKLEKAFFSLEHDIYMCFAHIPPQNSTYTVRTGDTVLEEISKDICNYSKQGMVMLLGDLNARIGEKSDLILNDDNDYVPNPTDSLPDSIILSRKSQDKHISPRGNGLLDLCMSSHMRILNGRTAGDCQGKFTCHNAQGSSVIDYVIISETLCNGINYFHVHDFDATFSDHCKLSVQLNVEVTFKTCPTDVPKVKMANVPCRFKWQASAVTRFQKALHSQQIQQQVERLIVSTNNEQMSTGSEEYAKALQDILISAADKSLPKTAPFRKKSTKKKFNKPWYDTDLRVLRQRVKEGSKQLTKNPSDPIVRSLFFRDVKYYNKVRKKKIKAYKQNLMANLENLENNNPKEFWSLLEKLKASSASNPKTESLISSDEWYNYFKLLNTAPQHMSDIEKQFGEKMKEQEKDEVFNELCYTITQTEISKAISRLKNGKAVSLDGISNEMIKAAHNTLLPCLAKVFNRILVSDVYPELWSKGYLSPIFKANDRHDPYNYRGIAINSCIGKLFNAVLNARLDFFLENHSVIHKTQIGSKKKARTADHIFIIKTLINEYFQTGKKMYTCFVDFTKAFDRVSRNCLLSTLLEYNIGGHFYKIIKSMFQQSKLCVKVNNQITPFFKSEIGVRQGDPLSANLFNIFINKIPTIFDNTCAPVKLNNKDLSCLLYADDVVLLSETKEGLQKSISYLKKFCDTIGMEINFNKSKIIIFNKAGKIIPAKFTIGDTELEIVKEYKYLGILLTPSGSFSAAKERLHQKSLKAYFKLCNVIQDFNKPDLGLHLFNHTITPILTYCSEIWGIFNPLTRNIDSMSFRNIYMHSKIEQTQRKFARFILGVSKYCSTDALQGELGWNPVYANIISAVIKYWHRITNMNDGSLLADALAVHKALKYREGENMIDTVQLMFQKLNIAQSLSAVQNLSESELSKLLKYKINSTIEREWQTALHKESKNKDGGKKLRLYRQFKTTFKLEPYLCIVKNKSHRRELCKLRTSCHALQIERGRYLNIEESQRLCTLCNLNKTESEEHFLIECTFYSNERRSFLDDLFHNIPRLQTHNSKQLFIWLMSCENNVICTNLARVVYECFKKRKTELNK